MSKSNTARKVFKIIGDVLLYAFIIICLASVIITVTVKKDSDGTATIFGKQIRIVMTESMEKCDQTDVSDYKIKHIPVNSVILIDTVPEDKEKAEKWYADLKVGDVLTFKYVYVRQETITHRITAIEKKPTGGYIIHLEGDNKNSDSKTLTQVIDTSEEDSPNYVIGKVTAKSYAFGMFIKILKHPAGIVCTVIIPACAIMFFEFYKIVKLFTQEKREKEKQESLAKDQELEELKRRLKELEDKNEK